MRHKILCVTNFCASHVRHVMDYYIRIKNKVMDKKHLVWQFIKLRVSSMYVDKRKLIFIRKPLKKKVNCLSHYGLLHKSKYKVSDKKIYPPIY